MKKILLFSLGLSTAVISASAQSNTFAPLGAEWTYRSSTQYASGMYQERRIVYKNIGEAIENGHNVKTIRKVVHKQNGSYNSSNGIGIYMNSRRTDTAFYKLYQSGDTVFVDNPLFGKYTPLYYFNVAVGDTLKVPVPKIAKLRLSVIASQVNMGDSVIHLLVDSVKMIPYGTQSLKTYFVTALYDSLKFSVPIAKPNRPLYNWTCKPSSFPPDTFTLNNYSFKYFKTIGAYTELFGGVGGEGLFPDQCSNPYTGIVCLFEAESPDTISCYKDNVIAFNRTIDKECDSFYYNKPFMSIKDVNAAYKVSIYPNPTSGLVTIRNENDFPKNATLYLTDITGKTVLAQQNIGQQNTIELNIGHLAAGSYVLVFEIEGERYSKKIVKGK